MKTDLLFSSFPFITGEKVTLAQITEMHADALWEIMGNDENYRFSPTAALQSREEIGRKLKRLHRLFQERRMVVLGIFPNNKEGQLCGILEISAIDPDVNQVTVSITLEKAYTGFGYGSAALRTVCKYLLETIEVNRIQSYVLPINYRAVLVLERCGFVKEGTIREGFVWPDKGLVDLTLYSLLPIDFRRAQKGEIPPSQKKEQTYYL
jgi:ribosomal-protein-alanine N-acetyltransferase